MNNEQVKHYLEQNINENIVYNYHPENLTVVENSDFAVKNSCGKYVCFLGDDDLFSPYVYEYVKAMDKYGIESSIFNVAKYYWPGISFVTHNFANLIIYGSKGKISKIDVKKEQRKLLKTGGYNLFNMPKLYHGIVRRDLLEKVYDEANTYFPGPSPDMANSIALSKFVTSHVYCDIPVISSGTSPKSTAGLGAEHKHVGDLVGKSFLPSDIEERWNNNIPKVWTGPTIYAQSFIEAVNKMNMKPFLDKYNYNYMYAAFVSFNPTYRKYFHDNVDSFPSFSRLKFNVALMQIFIFRARNFIKNWFITKLGKGAISYDGIKNTYEAELYIDDVIKKYDIERLMSKLG